MTSTSPLRLGILGAARHVPTSVMAPIQNNKDLAAKVEAVAVASHNLAEADTCAKKWGIQKAYGSYEEMLADPAVDAVYNCLPNALRCHWTVSALRAGKHVLCEAPLCSNAREALVLQRAAEDAGRVMLAGSHPTFHPVTKRIREMVLEGKVGCLQRIDLVLPVGISLEGGAVCSKVGALMGLGSYCVGVVRALASEEPRVVRATAHRSKDQADVDVAVSCDLSFPSGAAAHFHCSLAPGQDAVAELNVFGSNGAIRAKEWFRGRGESAYNIAIENYDGCGVQSVESMDSPNMDTRDTFYYQLMSFADEVQAQLQLNKTVGLPWDYTQSRATPTDAVMSMAVIDSIFAAAGMSPRKTAFPPSPPYDHIGASKL